jgi:hypothetical protein
MSTVGDILAGLKKILLLDDGVARLQADVSKLMDDVRRTREYAAEIDKRVVRIETLIEITERSAGQPRLGQ